MPLAGIRAHGALPASRDMWHSGLAAVPTGLDSSAFVSEGSRLRLLSADTQYLAVNLM